MRLKDLGLPLLAPVIAAVLLILAAPAKATSPGNNGRIAFVQGSGTGSDIFTMNPDGSAVKQLTSFGASGGQTCCVAWSPDGKQLAFAAAASASANAQLWIMDANGSSQHLLLNDPSAFDIEPSFSPDGGTVVFGRCGPINCAVYHVRVDGSGLTAVTHFNANRDIFDLWPAYSPDGTKIAFTSFNRNNGFLCAIYTVDADGSNFRLLTPPRLTAFQPDWSPDGTKVAFSTNSNFSTILDEEIWVIHSEGSGQPAQITNNNRHWNGYLTGPHDFSASWSPAGNKMVLERDSPDFSSSGIYVINADGSGETLVFQGIANRSMEFSRMAGAAPSNRLARRRHVKLIEKGGFSPRWGPASN
jgi:Tol biopolymer transport system component